MDQLGVASRDLGRQIADLEFAKGGDAHWRDPIAGGDVVQAEGVRRQLVESYTAVGDALAPWMKLAKARLLADMKQA